MPLSIRVDPLVTELCNAVKDDSISAEFKVTFLQLLNHCSFEYKLNQSLNYFSGFHIRGIIACIEECWG